MKFEQHRPALEVSAALVDESTIAGNALRSFAYSLIQSPLNGVTQLIDRATGSDLQAKVQIIDPVKVGDFGSVNWHAQQVGSAAGMVPWFIGLHKVMGRVGANAALAGETAATRTLGQELKTSLLVGGAYGGFLTPTSYDSSSNIVIDRLKSAATGAATFATLTASARGLHALGMESRVGVGMLSGAPAGIVHAQSKSLLNDGTFASIGSSFQDAYAFGVVGGLLGVRSDVFQGRSGNGQTGKGNSVESVTTPINMRINGVLNTLADGVLGPRPLFALAAEGPLPQMRPVEAPPLRPLILNMQVTDSSSLGTAKDSGAGGGQSEVVSSEKFFGSTGRELGTKQTYADGTTVDRYHSGYVGLYKDGALLGSVFVKDGKVTLGGNWQGLRNKVPEMFTEKRTNEGGTTKTEYPIDDVRLSSSRPTNGNGPEVTLYRDGTKVTKSAGETVTEFPPERLEISETKKADGTVVTRYRDGRVVRDNGPEIVTEFPQSDLRLSHTKIGGKDITRFRNGDVSEVEGNTSKTMHSDGRTVVSKTHSDRVEITERGRKDGVEVDRTICRNPKSGVPHEVAVRRSPDGTTVTFREFNDRTESVEARLDGTRIETTQSHEFTVEIAAPDVWWYPKDSVYSHTYEAHWKRTTTHPDGRVERTGGNGTVNPDHAQKKPDRSIKTR